MTLTHLELAPILIVAAIALNLPFGAYRATVKRLSWRWFAAIHVPIPFIFLIRIESGFTVWFIPFMLAGTIAGQLLGSWLLSLRRARRPVVEPITPAD